MESISLATAMLGFVPLMFTSLYAITSVPLMLPCGLAGSEGGEKVDDARPNKSWQ